MSWKNVSLADVSDVFNGKTPSKDDQRDVGHPVLKIKDVGENGYFKGPFESFVDLELAGKFSEKHLKLDDSLILNAAHNSDYVGSKQYRAEQAVVGALPTGEWLIARANTEKLHPRFLNYWLQSPQARFQIKQLVKGIHLYPKDVMRLEIHLPPLPEQKRIAAILDKADAIRRKRQQAIQLADDFLRAVFLDMFGDPVTNPKGWETFALADVVRKDSIITYGIVQAGEHVDGGVPYIRTGDFKGGRLVRSGYACTSTDIASKFKRSEVAPGDIVYCIRASVGSADVVPEFLAGANLTQGTAKISPAHDMKAEFLVELLRSAGFRSWIDKNSKGATFKEITLARLREAPVFKPPMFEQEAFVRVKEIVMERLVGKFQEADVPLFESLSQKAFSGQL